MFDEVSPGYFAHFVAGIVYRSQVRFHHPGNRIIIKADNGYIIRNRNTRLFSDCIQLTAQVSLATKMPSSKGVSCKWLFLFCY